MRRQNSPTKEWANNNNMKVIQENMLNPINGFKHSEPH